MKFRTEGGVYGTTYNNDISINYPSTDHDYHAYNGQTIAKDLGRTVYGCEVDIVSGVLTVDRAMVDLGTLNWTERVSGTRHWIADMPSDSIVPKSGGDKEALCERYE